MPIYEYVCRRCGSELERLQKLSDDPLRQCPQCGESALKRKVSAAGFRLSGQGWYETDFKSDGQRNLAGDKSAEAKSTQTGDAQSSGTSGGDKSASNDSKSAQSSSAGADSA